MDPGVPPHAQSPWIKISEGSAEGTLVEWKMFGLAQLQQAVLFLYIDREELIFCAIG